jgi:hypothetical protein
MKIKLLILILAFSSMLTLQELKAQDYAASVKVSTLGVNLEAYRSLSPEFNVRLGVGAFTLKMNNFTSTSDYYANGNLKLFTISALADWFPFENNLRISAGVFINSNAASILLVPTATKKSGNLEYTPDKLGTVSADVTFNKVAPYLGVGLGNPTEGLPGIGFTFDLGTFYQGKPGATMSGTKLLNPMVSQGSVLQDNLKWFQFYPVLSVGLYYKF